MLLGWPDSNRALGADLLALDEDEARKALADTEQEIERLGRHVARLRLAIQLRTTWVAAAEGRQAAPSTQPPQEAIGNASANGLKRPKTRSVLLETFDNEPLRRFTTKELLAILADHGITITAEGLRLALRRLIADKLIFKPEDGRYQSRKGAREGLFVNE